MKSREEWRRVLRRRRVSLSPRERREAALGIARQVARLIEFRRSRHIAVYLAVGSEISLSRLTIRHARNKSFYAPRIHGQHLHFLPLNEQLRSNSRGIHEPVRGRTRPLWAMSLVLMPLVGVDRQGNRLGQGGGYYDRSLGRLGRRMPLLVGAAFDCQVVDALPHADWDVPVDIIATPTEVIRCPRRRSPTPGR